MSFSTLSKPAANMIGTDIKKEKRAAAWRLKPCVSPPVIVDPERDTPGNMDNA